MRKKVLPYIVAILIMFSAAVFVRTVFHPLVISGSSMKPTFSNGDIVRYEPAEGDLILGGIYAFQQDHFELIKRLVALPGDTLYIENKTLYVNGKESPYRFEPIEQAGVLKEPITLSSDEYFFLGDNRNDSIDCRAFGPVKREQVNRVVTDIYFKR